MNSSFLFSFRGIGLSRRGRGSGHSDRRFTNQTLNDLALVSLFD